LCIIGSFRWRRLLEPTSGRVLLRFEKVTGQSPSGNAVSIGVRVVEDELVMVEFNVDEEETVLATESCFAPNFFPTLNRNFWTDRVMIGLLNIGIVWAVRSLVMEGVSLPYISVGTCQDLRYVPVALSTYC